ncbi:MAG TPA: hypothetical protein VFJ30_17400 [Phycisphaerae bacterium]|nr:hypothetical protein [Phycisphaerae bacterium]
MNRPGRHISAFVLTFVAVAGAVRADPATQPSPEAKLVAELYGKRVAAVMASPAEEDNLELAREMLLAAAESGNPPVVRYLLALEVVKLTASLGSAEAAKVAADALAFADQVGRLDPVRKAEMAAEIARTRFRAVCRANPSKEAREDAAGQIVAADLDLANALLDAGRLDEGDTVLKTVEGMVTLYRLSRARLESVRERSRGLHRRAAEIRSAEAMLALARQRGDAEGEKDARRRLGEVYLTMDGDVSLAADHLAGTAHPRADAVVAAGAFLKDPKALPAAGKVGDVVSELCAAAESCQDEQARKRVGAVAADLCRAFLQSGPEPLAATKVRLLLTQAERLAGQSPGDLLIQQIQAACGPLAGRFEPLSDGRVRVSYDFSDEDQYGDWTGLEGAWKVMASKNILAAGPQQYQRCRIEHRLAWRAGVPFKLSLRTSGQEEMEVQVNLLAGNRRKSPRYHRIRLIMGARSGRSWEIYDDRTRVYENTSVRPSPSTIYRVAVSWDARRTVTWSVNGRVLKEFQTGYETDKVAWSSVIVELGAYSQPAGFDNVVMEGLPLPDPTQEIPDPGKTN